MITTRITLKAHLVEWLRAKFNAGSNSPIRLNPTSDLCNMLWDLTRKRPVNAVDRGNCELVLPCRREGKRPEWYNYIPLESARKFERMVEAQMWAEIHLYIDEACHIHGVGYMTAISRYMGKYGIESISEDALQKHYYRWRKKVRPTRTREYRKRDNPDKTRVSTKKNSKSEAHPSLFCQSI